MKVANKDARKFVQKMIEFKGSNTFAEYQTHGGTWRYVVYSYGYHFPMYVAEWIDGDMANAKWYENSDKYSASTSKQQSQLRPSLDCIKLCTEDMKAIASGGVANLVYQKANEFI